MDTALAAGRERQCVDTGYWVLDGDKAAECQVGFWKCDVRLGKVG